MRQPFKIEYSDYRFRVVSPDGNYEDAVSFCSFSTVEVDGDVYVAYLSGDEPELEKLQADESAVEMKTTEIKVYKVVQWPRALEPVETVIEECEFDADAADASAAII